MISSESDKGRVINSAAFRRLQQKAQVFPLDRNAAVRTRLTHSIEVAQVGRYLAQKIIEKCDGEVSSYPEFTAFVNTVETSCLLHDIGNPPFGHLGEFAIQEWFCSYDKKLKDFCEFDGNPQGFRLITLLSGRDLYGFNLTCAQILSTIKYPWRVDNKPDGKKIGVFSGDNEAYEQCCSKVGWTPGHRFPFVYIMEAADDIAYSMSDLEDGLEKKIIDIRDLKEEFGAARFERSGIGQFVSFKTSVVNEAVDIATTAFVDNLDAILRGEKVSLLGGDSEIGTLLSKVNDYARKKIYSHEDAENVELAGRSIIKGLLRHFEPLLELDGSKFLSLVRGDQGVIKKEKLNFEIRLFNLLPDSYVEKYRTSDRGTESIRRAHLIVDFISGMTDGFALKTYQIFEGIRIK